jgi:phosphonate transport system permease protein
LATRSISVPAHIRQHPLAGGAPRVGLGGTLTTLALLVVIGWAWAGTNASPGELVTSAPNMWDFLRRLFPPDWRFFTSRQHVVEPTIATMQLAITGTAVAVLLAFPISLLAARNLSHPAIYQTIRAILNVIRSIPELIWALIFVSAVGLGTVGSLSKVFAESIEAINPRPVEAMSAVGATTVQTVSFGVLPQALVSMVSYALLYWEHNIRASFIVGAVGGGGLGFEITTELNLFRYHQFLVHAIIIVVLVTLADRLSAWVRRRLA